MTAPARMVAALFPLVIAAGPALAGGKQDEAKALFEQGLEHYSQKLYAKALVSFLDSYDLNPEPDVLYNIALCYEKIDQDKMAIEYYEKYLATVEEEKERARILARIEAVEAGQDPDAVDDDPGYAEDEDMGRPDDDEAWPKKKKKEKKAGDDGSGEKVSKKEKIKKKFTGEYKGDWMHGLHVVAAADVDLKNPAYPSGETGIGIKGGYSIRLLERKLLLGLEIGYLSVETWDRHRFSLTTQIPVLYRVGIWLDGTIQLYVGGALDFRWTRCPQGMCSGWGTIGFGGDIRLLWHWGDRAGLLVDVTPLFAINPADRYGASGLLNGFVCVRLGLFFGVR